MAQTKLMGKAKVEYEKGEGAEGASVKMGEKPSGKPAGISRLEIEVVESGGYIVTAWPKEKKSAKRGEIGPYQPPEKHVCDDLDALDDLVDSYLGVED